MAEARSRGYFGIGVEGVSKSANVGALLRTAHAFGAAFCFIVGAGFDARAGRLADTADTPEHVPLWRFPDLRRAEPATTLRAGRGRAAGRCHRPAVVPTSGERSLCSGPGAVRPVASHAAALPPRGADTDSVRAQPGGGRRAGAVRPPAAARPLCRASGRQPAVPLPPIGPWWTRCAALPSERSRLGGSASKAHDAIRACRAQTHTVSLLACARIVIVLSLILALPSRHAGATESRACSRPEGAWQIR